MRKEMLTVTFPIPGLTEIQQETIITKLAEGGLENLFKLMPRAARRLTVNRQEHHAAEEIVPSWSLAVGDKLRVLPGEAIPADGTIIQGSTAVNQVVITGETSLVDKQAGDKVLSGTVNQGGAFTMRAEKTGEDSTVQRLIRLVQKVGFQKSHASYSGMLNSFFSHFFHAPKIMTTGKIFALRG